jgi:hypothetical protein
MRIYELIYLIAILTILTIILLVQSSKVSDFIFFMQIITSMLGNHV